MDMMESDTQTQTSWPKPKKGRSSAQYFRDLLDMGYLAAEAADIVDIEFGYSDEREQGNLNRQAKANQMNQLGQVAGQTGTILIANKLLNSNPSTTTTGQNVNYGEIAGSQPTASTSATGSSQQLPTQQRMIPSESAYGGTSTTGTQTAAEPTTTPTEVTKPTTEMPGGTTSVDTPSGTREVPNEALNDPEFTSKIDWGKTVQGATGAWQLYNAYQDWKKGDKTSAAINAVSGTTNVAAALSNQTASSVAPYLASGVEVYKGAKSQFNKNLSEKEKNYELAMTVPRAVAAYYTAGLSSLAEGLARKQWGGTMGKLDKMNQEWYSPIGRSMKVMETWGSSKKEPQILRDKIRVGLQNQGFLDQDFKGTLADGSQFDFGKDGSYLKGKNLEKRAAENKEAWNSVGNLSSALVAGYGLTGQKNSDVAVLYQNAAVSNANNDPAVAKANMRHFAEQQGLGYYDIKAKLDTALENNQVSQAQYDSWLAGANELFSNEPLPVIKPREAEPSPAVIQKPGVISNKPILKITRKQMQESADAENAQSANITTGKTVTDLEKQQLIKRLLKKGRL